MTGQASHKVYLSSQRSSFSRRVWTIKGLGSVLVDPVSTFSIDLNSQMNHIIIAVGQASQFAVKMVSWSLRLLEKAPQTFHWNDAGKPVNSFVAQTALRTLWGSFSSDAGEVCKVQLPMPTARDANVPINETHLRGHIPDFVGS